MVNIIKIISKLSSILPTRVRYDNKYDCMVKYTVKCCVMIYSDLLSET